MNVTTVLQTCATGVFGMMSMLSAPGALAAAPPTALSLAGTWTLVAADVLHADGTRTRDYGAAPKGLLMIDAQGRYTLQIFKAERPRFVSGEKATNVI